MDEDLQRDVALGHVQISHRYFRVRFAARPVQFRLGSELERAGIRLMSD
jgi:hypothetical protein